MTDFGRFVREYLLAATASAVMLPALAATTTTALDIASWKGTLNHDGAHTCLYGAGLGVASWLLVTLLCRRFAHADGANPSTYGELAEVFARLEQRVHVAEPDDPGDAEQRIAAAEARAQASWVRRVLDGEEQSPSLAWVIASGYVDLWKRVHRVEEALMEYEPPSDLLRDALIDHTRLQDSTIGQSTQLLHRLDVAVSGLDSGRLVLGDAAAAPQAHTPGLPAARSALRQVRLAVNEFRDARREGLVRARNLLLLTVALTGATAYTLVVVAILSGAKPGQVAAAAAFFLVGALIGLFKLLGQAAAAATTGQDDFGFAVAQLIHTPLFSGLAAVGGIVLTTVFPAVLPTTTKGPTVLDLASVFNLQTNQTAFVVAAIFGLSPNLLIRRLQLEVEKYKGDLKSSDPGEAAPHG